MPGFDHQVLTDVGWDALADALSAKTLTFTHLSAGDGNITGGDAQMQGMTSLVHKTMDFPITSASDDGKGQITLIGTLTNINLAPGSGFYWRELGVICTINNGPDILYSVSNAGATADFIPDNASPKLVETIQIVVKIDRGVSPVINVVDMGTVTAQNIGLGTVGPGLYRDKIGSVLNFKRLVSQSGSIACSDHGDTVSFDLGLPAGIIWEYGGVTPPTGWLLCDGSIRNISDYPNLAPILGNRFGGDGTTTFGLPDMRGRVSVGSGAGSGLTNRLLGAIGGVETYAISITEMPVHSHSATQSTHNHSAGDSGHVHSVYDPTHTHVIINCVGQGINTPAGPGQSLYQPLGQINTVANSANVGIYTGYANISVGSAQPAITVTNTGSGAAHPNMQPFIVINKIIKV
jgi:microcystin-dependent protein